MLKQIIEYFNFLKLAFKNTTKPSILFSQTLDECIVNGLKSVPLISFLSLIIGAVCGIHLTSMLKGMIFSEKVIPLGLKNVFFLEFSPAVMCIVFVGKNITAISGQLYLMKTSGQFDNFKVVGINIPSYTCLPKIIATTIVYPLLTVFSCFFALFGGFLLCVTFNKMDAVSFLHTYISMYNFKYITLCIVKSIVFGFLCGSISTYIGYSYDTSKNDDLIKVSQKCFTICCMAILISDIILNFLNYYITSN